MTEDAPPPNNLDAFWMPFSANWQFKAAPRLLVAAEGFSYEDAAEIAECAVGTVKSRVNRARKRLAELMHLSDTDVFGTSREFA